MRQKTLRRGRSKSAWLALAMAAVLLAVVLLAGCGGSKPATKVVRMGFLRNDLHQLAYQVCVEEGYYRDAGLDVREGGAFNAGPEEMSAFAAGELDMGYVGAAPAVTFAGQGMSDIKIVAQANQEGSALVVRNGTEGEDVASLRGRTVAVPGYSTMQDLLFRTALPQAKMAPTDVNIITLKPPEMIPTMASGQIDAFVAWEPYPTMAVQQNVGRVMLTSHQIWPNHPCCMLVADSNFLKKNPDLVKKVVEAHVKATDFINANKLESASIAHMFSGQEQKLAEEAMKNIAYTVRPDIKAIERYAVFLKESGVLKNADPAGFARGMIELQFLPKEKN